MIAVIIAESWVIVNVGAVFPTKAGVSDRYTG